MAVKIRLKRMGTNKKPFYRIVIADSRMPRDGRFIEEIGFYDPLQSPPRIVLQEDRASFWIQKGASEQRSHLRARFLSAFHNALLGS